MALFTDYILLDLLLTIVPIIYLIYWYITNNDDYWDKRGVPSTKKSVFKSQLLGTKSLPDIIQEIYDEFPGARFGGFFQVKKPVLIAKDPQLIHRILVKDFAHFPDRGFTQLKNNLLLENLFNLKGYIWRALRYKLTPTFTTGKIKGMFEQVTKSGDNMIEKIDKVANKNDQLETRTFLFEFTLDVILSSAFGLQVQPSSPDFEQFKKTAEMFFRSSFKNSLKILINILSPKTAEFFNFQTVPQEIEDYYVNLTRSTLQYRKENNIQRNDYFQLLMTLKEQEDGGKDMISSTVDVSEDDKVVNQMQYTGYSNQGATPSVKLFTENSICANSFVFLTAGSESTSSTTSLILLELSRHPEIQQRLQQEVDTVLAKHGGWTYETVKDMTYLEMVVQEMQRLYPSVPMMMRECVQPYQVPDSDLVIEKGVLVLIPVWGVHRDPQHYPDPEQFKPERFEGNNFKPSPIYMPFGDGPRICIAMRFAIMEVKTCVAKIMSEYSVKLGSKTQLPIRFQPRNFLPVVKGGIWLSFEKRKNKYT